jgi:hypothetical protein
MLLLVCATIPVVQAQITYTYRGNRLTGKMAEGDLFHGQTISAKLVTDEIIPADTTNPPDYKNSKTCPATWTFAIAVGSTVFDSKKADRATCSYVGSIGNPLAPAYLYLEIRQGNDAVHICSHIHHRTYETLPCNGPPHDPNVDWVESDGPDRQIPNPLNTAKAESGTWSAPKPEEVAAALLARLPSMNMPGQTAFMARITSAKKNIEDGAHDPACADLRAAMSAQDAAALRWVEYISEDLKCSGK